MKLDDAQKHTVKTWIDAGLKLSDIQNKIAAEFGVSLTYMDVRFLVDDLKVMPKDPTPPPKPPEPTPAPAPAAVPAPGGVAGENEFPEDELPPENAGNVKLEVDALARPGAMVSGTVSFSDGQTAQWYLDQTGRLGFVPKQPGYRPPAADLQVFQMQLQHELQKMGF